MLVSLTVLALLPRRIGQSDEWARLQVAGGCVSFLCLFFFKQKTAYEIEYGLVGSEMCIRDR